MYMCVYANKWLIVLIYKCVIAFMMYISCVSQ